MNPSAASPSPSPHHQSSPIVWAAFLRANHRQLTAYAFGFVPRGAEADAQDLIQDALLGLVRAQFRAGTRLLNPSSPPADPLAYALRSIRNAAIDRARQRARHGRFASTFTAESSLVPDSHAAEPDLANQIRDAMNNLTAPQQEVLLLRTWCGLQFAQIALVMSLPVGTVASHHARALARLQSTLAPLRPLEATRD